jgi:hypothetical protein
LIQENFLPRLVDLALWVDIILLAVFVQRCQRRDLL